jgi:hypothetical protein
MAAKGAPIGSQNAVTHGGAGAIKRIANGQPLIGLALEEELRMQDKYNAEGAAPQQLQLALRLNAAANLYWDALSKAADAGDLKVVDRYVRCFGWLASKALLAWDVIGRHDKNKNRLDLGASIIEAMNNYEQNKE